MQRKNLIKFSKPECIWKRKLFHRNPRPRAALSTKNHFRVASACQRIRPENRRSQRRALRNEG